MTPDQLKAQFRASGQTFSQWARDHGYRPQQVLRLINGFDKGHRGQAHEIAVALGIEPKPKS